MKRENGYSSKFMVKFFTYTDTLQKKIFSQLGHNSLLKGVIILGSGTAISQILGIIFVPIITRLYPPAIYGTLAVFSSLLSLLIVGGSMKYELTIPIAEKDDEAEYLVILSFLIVGTFSIILSLILAFGGNYLAGVFHFEFIEPYYWLFSLGFLGACTYKILTYWTLRSKNYTQITKTKVTQSISGSVSKIIFGVLSFGSLGLICGDIIGRIVGIGSLGKIILPRIWKSIHHLDIQKLRSLAFRYRKFPLYSMPTSIINETSLQIPTLFLSSIFGFQTVGLFALSSSILLLPISFVSTSISQVYTAESSELFRQKSDKSLALFQKTSKKLLMFGGPVILMGALISPVVFPIIFGSAWKEAGTFVLPMSIMVIGQFVVNSTDRLEMFGYNHWGLAWAIIRVVLVSCGFYFAFLVKLSPVATILVFSLIMTMMYAILYILNIKAIKRYMQT